VKLNLFVAWSAYALALASVLMIALTIVAVGYGFTGWAMVAAVAAVVALGAAFGMVAGTVRRDHRRHYDTPHLF
jgi:small-conductance mechanosensitive channel